MSRLETNMMNVENAEKQGQKQANQYSPNISTISID